MIPRIDRDESRFAADNASAWRAWLLAAGLPVGEQLRISSFDPASAVVIDRTKAHKVIVRDQVTLPRRNSLAGEASILDACAGIAGVPHHLALSQTNDVDVLTLVRLKGRSMRDVSRRRRWTALFQLAVVLTQISRRGVSHNDITETNVLVLDSGRVALLDFDQATIHSPIKALRRNFIGVGGAAPVYGSLWTLLTTTPRRWARRSLSPRIRRLLRRPGVTKPRQLPLLPPGAPRRLALLRNAWSLAAHSDASAPGVSIAYYELVADGYVFPGERRWEPRWQVLRGVVDLRGLRILELGANMALLSAYSIREGGAAAALAVDADPNILAAASLVAEALEVPTEFRCVDFDRDTAWEDDLSEFEPDVVFALNVLNWLSDKDRFLRFLSRFNRVVLEGHDSLEHERDRLLAHGFAAVEQVAVSERERPVILASKS